MTPLFESIASKFGYELDNNPNQGVMEGIGGAIGVGAAGLGGAAVGWTIGCAVGAVISTAINAPNKIKLKKAIKLYERYASPSIHASDLTVSTYKLTKDHTDISDKKSKLYKLKNFLAVGYASVGRVWEYNGKCICSSIYRIKNGTLTSEYICDVDSKYKKDSGYLYAVMCLRANIYNDEVDKFVQEAKKKYPDEWDSIRVKVVGESTEYVTESTYSNWEDGSEITLMESNNPYEILLLEQTDVDPEDGGSESGLTESFDSTEMFFWA